MTADQIAALEAAAQYSIGVGADEIGIPPSAILSLITTIRDLERERDEARTKARELSDNDEAYSPASPAPHRLHPLRNQWRRH